MLLNPYAGHIGSIEGTPFLQDARLLPYLGTSVVGADPQRVWTIQAFLAPARKRIAIRGVRVKLQDQKGVITFCNQRDIEVLLGLGKPGGLCFWLGRQYVAPTDTEWVGMFSDEESLWDDIYERELMLRSNYTYVPEGTTVTRYVHIETGVDVEETYMFLRDYDPTINLAPDPRYETVQQRWVRVERCPVQWELL